MPPNIKTPHIHRLKRHRYKNGTPVFFCTLDNCNFKIGIEFSLGKSNICWRCGSSFEMNSYSIRLAKPHCPNCHKVKGDEDITSKVITNQPKQDSSLENLQNNLHGGSTITYEEIHVDDETDIL